MIKISNKNVREYVEARKEFDGNNTFARNENGKYKVYSYGLHFPIFAYVNEKWYKNIEKYSVTTSKHQSQLKPCFDCIGINTEAIKAL